MFTMMVIANVWNWTLGGMLMGLLGHLVKIPKSIILPVILTVSLTAAYTQDGGYLGLLTAAVFSLIGYGLRRLDVSILPFVIGFLLAPTLEGLVRGAFTASGGDPFFLLKSPIALGMLAVSAFLLIRMVHQARRA
jgi:putative tricarboxylic transport membrane protein